jgi:hypothetical protein
MRFNPQSVSTTVGIARTAVILIYLLFAGALVAVLLKDNRKDGTNETNGTNWK